MLKRALDRMALDGDVVVGSFRQYACSHGNRNEPPPVTRDRATHGINATKH